MKHLLRTLLALGCCLLAATSSAQRIAKLSFVMPQSVDPAKLFIADTGITYTRDSVGDPITGATFQNGPALPFKGGLEVHGNVPDPVSGPSFFLPIDHLTITTNYIDPLDVQTTAGFGPFTPWIVESQSVNGGIQTVVLAQGANGAPLSDNMIAAVGYFGLLRATNTNPTFNGSAFAIRGQVTPEPGTLALLLSVAVVGTGLVRRRRNPAPPRGVPHDVVHPTSD